MLTNINNIILVICSFILIWFLITLIIEKAFRGIIWGIIFFIVNIVLWSSLNHFEAESLIRNINVIMIGLLSALIIISLIPYFPKEIKTDLTRILRFDERDHMFARNNLQHHPELAKKYYKDHPELRQTDADIHKLPELLSEGGRYYDELFAALGISFDAFTTSTRHSTSFPVSANKFDHDLEELTGVIIKAGKYLGAADIGITCLSDYHLYSYSGRQAENWGQPIENDHTHAIAILVPMRWEQIKKAPALPQIIESTHKYIETAKIAHVLTNFIKRLGYDARAHFDGQYQVACVPVAQDAGLGETGRLSLLMHHKFGPCVRLSVVTTTLPLIETKAKPAHMEQFCNLCKKCAENCPSNSIPEGAKPLNRGFSHWSVNMETCYTFWKKSGTDCGICLRVCPFSKPDTLLHRLVRFYVSRNSLNQRIALFLDDLFYGRRIKVDSRNPSMQKMI